MNLFAIDLKAGSPIYEQVLYAARKAILSGELKPGDPFPSVREIASHLRINPNTVQKALTALKTEGLVETVPGIGNRVCESPEPRAAERAALLNGDLEALVLRARQLRLDLTDLEAALREQWSRFDS
ncbi:MAG: GntR family transcriptional regulator [Verrucomicrobiaceae bacterium]|nr:MAG: GntR family transcriptional regulator [Verrucomicrobiaceae bacterium]